MSNFSEAFKRARSANKGLFMWNNKLYTTRYANESEEDFRSKFKDYNDYKNGVRQVVQEDSPTRIVSNDINIPPEREQKTWTSEVTDMRYKPKSRTRSFLFFKDGGQLNMNEQELQQAFIQFLAQKTGAKSQQELEAVIQQLGEEGLRQAYAEFMQIMQQQQVQAAKFGAKLNYIKHLRGNCPEGYEMQYFKSGGQLCKKCIAKQKTMQDGGELSNNPIDAFKCGSKMKKKKAEGGNIEFDKCGKKMKKKECGGTMNKKWTPKNK